MTTPKIIVFDLGKVLLDFDYSIAIRRLLPRMKAGILDIGRLLTSTPLLADYECGRIDTAEFFRRVQAEVRYDGTFEEFAAGFGDIFREIPEMIALHAEVRRAARPAYIFSNTNELAIDFIRRTYPFYTDFTGHVLSYECGSMKPEPRMYEVLEQLSECQGAEVFYLDDRPENIAAGRARGWQAVEHVSPAQSRQALVNAGVLK